MTTRPTPVSEKFSAFATLARRSRIHCELLNFCFSFVIIFVNYQKEIQEHTYWFSNSLLVFLKKSEYFFKLKL